MPAIFGVGAAGVGQWNRNRNYELQRQHLELQQRIMATQEKERSMRMELMGTQLANAYQEYSWKQEANKLSQGQPVAGTPTDAQTGQPPYGAPGVQGPPPEGMAGPGQTMPSQPPVVPEPGAGTEAPLEQADATKSMQLVQHGRQLAQAKRLAAQTANPQEHQLYGSMIDHYADQYAAPPQVAAIGRTIAYMESGGEANPGQARSSKGAIGPMQLMPETAQALGVDPTNPGQNVQGGVRLIQLLYDKYQGNVGQVLRSYYGGEDEKQWGDKTEAYAQKGMQLLGLARAPAGEPPAVGQATTSLPPLPVPEHPSNPLAPGTPLGQAAGLYKRELQAQKEFNTLIQASRPGIENNPEVQRRRAALHQRLMDAGAEQDKAIQDKLGPVDDEFNRMVFARTNKTPRDLLLQGPSGNGLGGPEMLQALRQQFTAWQSQQDTLKTQGRVSAENTAKQSVRSQLPLNQAHPDNFTSFRDVATGEPLNSRTPMARVDAQLAAGLATQITPERTKELDTLNDARAELSEGQRLYAAAKQEMGRVDIAVNQGTLNLGSKNIETYLKDNSGTYPAIAAYQTWKAGAGHEVVRKLGVPEKAVIDSLPNMAATFNGAQILTGTALAASTAALRTLVGGFAGGMAAIGGAREVIEALSQGRTITNQQYADIRMDLVKRIAETATGRILGKKGWEDQQLQTFFRGGTAEVPVPTAPTGVTFFPTAKEWEPWAHPIESIGKDIGNIRDAIRNLWNPQTPAPPPTGP